MPKPLSNSTLQREVVEETMKEREEAELAAQRAKVKRVVDDILDQMKRLDAGMATLRKKTDELGEHRFTLQDQLNRIKAGDASAVKHPEKIEDRNMEAYLRERFGGRRHPGFYRW